VPDIFDEVSEDLRAERAQAMLKKYGGVLVAAALLVLAATGGWQGWRWYQARENARVATIYIDALRAADRPAGADRDAARPLLSQVATDGSSGYRTLARLRDAALKADSGDLAAALALYNQVATDSAADPLLRDLPPEPRFYFVHSYHLVCDDATDVLTWTQYGHRFASALQRGNIWGTQFHPEKSHKFGLALLKNFLAL